MRDAELVDFLQWALPRLKMRWAGFRKVRKQVGQRLGRRLRELDLVDLAAYRRFLTEHPAEWRQLDGLCRVTISRFYRDRRVWDAMRARALCDLVREAQRRGEDRLRVWSCGCASGEEPYTVALAWHLELAPIFPDLRLAVLASDTDPVVLSRARRARYPASSLRELPPAWRERAFLPCAGGAATEGGDRDRCDVVPERGDDRGAGEALLELRAEWRRGVGFLRHDWRSGAPGTRFDLILCRNLVFTYADDESQRRAAAAMGDALVPEGLLLLAPRETPPPASRELEPVTGIPGLFRSPPIAPAPIRSGIDLDQ